MFIFPIEIFDQIVGWTPLHHAALRAPATLVVYLMAHGASCLAQTLKSCTPLDLISAFQPIPGRRDVALILQESMREQGWQGGPLEQRRSLRQRLRDSRRAKNAKSASEWSKIGQILGLEESWWGESSSAGLNDVEEEDTSDESSFEAPDEIAPDFVLVCAALVVRTPAPESLNPIDTSIQI